MTINIILNTAAFLLCSAAGYMQAYNYHCRTVNLQSCLYAMKYLQDEVMYKKTPLPEAVKLLGESKCSNAAKTIFQGVARDFEKNSSSDTRCSFEESWYRNVIGIADNSAFLPQDTETLAEIGKVLGGTDYMGQKGIFERSNEQISKLIEEAKEAEASKGKMYKGLGIAVGLLLVVLML